MNKNFTNLSLNPKLTAQIVKGEVTLVDSSGVEIADGNAMQVTLVDSSGTELTSFEINNTGAASVYIGKPSNGDFVTAYASATTIDFTSLPSDVTTITDEDIEIVRQIATDGSVTRTYTRDDVIMAVAANTLTVTGATFVNTDTFVVYTNIPRPGGGGGASADANYKIASWEGTATYASTTTITIAGAYPTINNNSQVVYIKFTDDTLHTSETFVNAQNGVTIEHAAGTLTIYGAGTPFAATNDYEVGVNATPVGTDIDGDSIKTSEQVTTFGHFTDVEHIVDESDLGIDGTHDGGNNVADFTDTGETYTAETVAEGYLIYNVTDSCSALIDSGGAGDPTADDINHEVLAGGGDNDWDNTDVASIPEVKRFEFSAESYPLASIHAKLVAGANNKVFLKIYGTNNSSADTTDDTDWIDLSLEILGAAEITATTGTTTEDIYIIDQPTIMLKYCLKVVVECTDGVQSNSADIYLKKGF